MNNDISYIDICNSPPEWQGLLRVWRNKPHVRYEMIFQNEISREEHNLWLAKVLSPGSTDKIRIAVSNGVPFGMIRLKDINRDHCSSDWGFYIGEESFIGLGLGKKMLMDLIDWAFTEEKLQELHTKVNKSNIKAQNIYKKFGFKIVGETGDIYTMSLERSDESTIWTVGHGGNGREMPLELKRRFAWVFASTHLPLCIDNGAIIEIKPDSADVHLKWRNIIFKLNSYSDIEILSKNIPYADVAVPKSLPMDCEWGFVAFDTRNDLGFSALLAVSFERFKKIITFCDNSANFMLNSNHSRIESLPQELKDNMEELCSRFDNLPIFVGFSLTGVDNPIELADKIKNCGCIKGISVKNDLQAREKELPEKIIEIMQDSGFKGSAMNRVYVGFRE